VGERVGSPEGAAVGLTVGKGVGDTPVYGGDSVGPLEGAAEGLVVG